MVHEPLTWLAHTCPLISSLNRDYSGHDLHFRRILLSQGTCLLSFSSPCPVKLNILKCANVAGAVVCRTVLEVGVSGETA
jgi:hypothetical protein